MYLRDIGGVENPLYCESGNLHFPAVNTFVILLDLPLNCIFLICNFLVGDRS